VAIEVEDNGCGIAPENLNRIFTYGFTTNEGKAWRRAARQRLQCDRAGRQTHGRQRRHQSRRPVSFELPIR
jgi:hypothetical protein